jgi:F0F1-type ATP synthase delta subunit
MSAPRGRRRRCRAAVLGMALFAAAAVAGAMGSCWVTGLNVFQSGHRSPQLSGRLASKAPGPVLDDSDFDLEDDSKNSDKKTSDLNSILDAADKFAIKKDKQKKKSSSLMSLEDELKGMVIEDEADLSVGLMKRARTGKVDVSLEGRLSKWAMETKDLVTNPTKLQITYVTIFTGSVVLLILAGIFMFAAGAIHFKGEGIDWEERARAPESEEIRMYKRMKANREKAVDVDIASAQELDAGQQKMLADALSEKLERKVNMQVSLDKSLLGGAVIRAGDTVIDGSIRGRLTKLAESFNS